jgi:PAS domain S-box-containing protein
MQDNSDPRREKSNRELLRLLSTYKNALEAEQRYHATLDNMMEGLQIITYDWKYFYVNDTVVKQSKYKREELIGFSIIEKYPGIERSDMFKALAVCMKERSSQNFENKFDYPDGSSGWFELRIQPVSEGLLILSLDITERKKAEEQKRQYIRNLEEMIHMTSHKVRQPVAHILGLSNIINSDVTEEERNRMLNYIRDAASSLDDFTRELTTFIHELELKARS